jgi:hypothetical protein
MNQITLSENVMVSDPCYTPDTWCQTKLNNVLPGRYNVEVEKSDEGDWGTRVSSITVIHEDYTDGQVDWDDHSSLGVDSGQCGIFCMTSYRNDELSESITTPTLDNPFVIPFREDGDKWYEKICHFTLDKQQWGLYDTGVVSSSGFGDGQYPLEVMEDGDKVVGIKITYLGHGDDELFDEEEEETDMCGVCGGELDSDGSCEYCENQKNED